jgi:hypothetical protein
MNDDGTLELVVFSVYGGMLFNHNVLQVGQNEATAEGIAPTKASHWQLREIV